MENVKSFIDFKNKLTANEELQRQFKDDPLKAIEKFQPTFTIPPDAWIYRIVVSSLGLGILFVIVGLILLILNGKQTTELSTIFTAIASGAIGALAGLLAPSPRTNGNGS